MSILYACVLGHRDRRYGVFGPLICAAFLTACDAAKTRAPDARSPRESTAPLQEPIVEKRAHWAAFERRLPADPLAAASALEHYRRANGLPFDFTVALDSTSGRARGLHVTEDDMGAGAYVTAFVRQMPDSTSALVTSTVYEFDEKGRSYASGRFRATSSSGTWSRVSSATNSSPRIERFRRMYISISVRTARIAFPPIHPRRSSASAGSRSAIRPGCW